MVVLSCFGKPTVWTQIQSEEGDHMTLEQMRTAIAEAGKVAMAGGPSAGNRRVLFEQAVKEVRLIRANAIKWRTFLKTTPGAAGKAKKVRERAERRLGQFIIAMNDAGFLTDGRAIPGYKAGKLPKNTLTLTQLGITKDESKQFQKLARDVGPGIRGLDR
jgi:hypothetical protein